MSIHQDAQTIIRQALQGSELALQVRGAVNGILTEQMEQAVRLLTENRDTLDRMVSVLLVKNHLTGEEIDRLIQLRKASDLRTIKNWILFFGVMAVIGLCLGGISLFVR